uniref:Putative recombinase n=1 Tax=Sphingomonas sp. KSM1 TaxID=1228049 RepID=M1VMI5_9SPHN|nr:putative recombinase [Sphingomonas sp. KSM1]
MAITKAAIYARYSSKLQDSRSVDDQVRICRERAARESWEVVEVFADYAISGAVRDRPGLNALLEYVAAGEVDIILAEAIDRISRDQEDQAYIFKRVVHSGARLVTLSEGTIDELQIGFKGTMAALFRKDLADKIKRGQKGRVAAGRIPGNICYGYRKVVRLDAKGEPELGLREIDSNQAAVVRRIYREFIAGLSPREIAQRLNTEEVPSPTGREWRVSMINGDAVRQNGILQNEIYVGQLVYNRTRMVRDPVTRRRIPKVNPKTDWVRHPVPELRIVDQADWDAVRARRKEAVGWSYRQQRKPKRLLSGMVACSECGGQYIVVSGELWGCSKKKSAGSCSNGRKVTTAELERRVLNGLQQQLLDPEVVRTVVREYHELHAKARADNAAARARLEKKLNEIASRVDRLVDAIARGAGHVEEVVDALAKAKVDRVALERELADIDALPVIALHPNIAHDYRRAVESLADAVRAPDARIDAVPAIRSLIDEIIVSPSAKPRGVDIEVAGRLASIIALATGQTLENPSPAMYVSNGSGGGT